MGDGGGGGSGSGAGVVGHIIIVVCVAATSNR